MALVSARRRNLSHVVADELLARIRSGELAAGSRIPTERTLMEMFSVGRNTIREAVQSLVALGLLDVRPGRGTIVIDTRDAAIVDSLAISALLQEPTVKELFEFRRLLESEIAALAAERATAEDIVPMQRALGDHRKALEEGTPTWSADAALHGAIAQASCHAVYIRVLDALSDLLRRARLATYRLPGGERAQAEHHAIVAAIAEHNASAARAAMWNHLDGALRRIATIETLLEAGDEGTPV